MENVLLSDIPETISKEEYLRNYIHDGNFELIISYKSNFSNTPKLRQLVESLFDIYELDPKDKNRLVLVSDELNNNAVEHGSGDCDTNELKVTIQKTFQEMHINIEVTDCGEGSAEFMRTLKRKVDMHGFEKHHGIRGRGLFLITERIADRLYFEDAPSGGLVVGIEKTL